VLDLHETLPEGDVFSSSLAWKVVGSVAGHVAPDVDESSYTSVANSLSSELEVRVTELATFWPRSLCYNASQYCCCCCCCCLFLQSDPEALGLLAQREDEVATADRSQMLALSRVLLACAVQCDSRAEYIACITSLPSDAQAELMRMIQEVNSTHTRVDCRRYMSLTCGLLAQVMDAATDLGAVSPAVSMSSPCTNRRDDWAEASPASGVLRDITHSARAQSRRDRRMSTNCGTPSVCDARSPASTLSTPSSLARHNEDSPPHPHRVLDEDGRARSSDFAHQRLVAELESLRDTNVRAALYVHLSSSSTSPFLCAFFLCFVRRDTRMCCALPMHAMAAFSLACSCCPCVGCVRVRCMM